MHIISWNVAGWSATAANLRNLYNGSLASFLDSLKADVIALQETKVPRSKLKDEPIGAGACDKGHELHGWESFWACPSLRGLLSFNGVATFVKKGLTRKADASPLRVAELDAEGRCLVTVFSHCALFNVYVPHSRQGDREAVKIEFLCALKRAIDRVRTETGLPVILAGDLNLTYRPQDVHWSHRRLNFASLCAHLKQNKKEEPEPQSKSTDDVGITFFSKEESTTMAQSLLDHFNTRDSESRPVDSKYSSLGDVTEEDQERLWVYPFLRGESPSEYNQRWYKAAMLCGEPPHSYSSQRWMNELLSPINDAVCSQPTSRMVDTFAAVFPNVSCCYTCFNQYQNHRYTNEGSRIDYILADPSLSAIPGPDAASWVYPPAPDRSLMTPMNFNQLFVEYGSALGTSMRHGIALATANGRFQPAPLDKSGLAPFSRAELEKQLTDICRTGIIYTPPQLSDHLAISAVFDLTLLPCDGKEAVFDESTNACIFRPATRSVMSFFRNAPPAGKNEKCDRNPNLSKKTQRSNVDSATTGKAKKHQIERENSKEDPIVIE